MKFCRFLGQLQNRGQRHTFNCESFIQMAFSSAYACLTKNKSNFKIFTKNLNLKFFSLSSSNRDKGSLRVFSVHLLAVTCLSVAWVWKYLRPKRRWKRVEENKFHLSRALHIIFISRIVEPIHIVITIIIIIFATTFCSFFFSTRSFEEKIRFKLDGIVQKLKYYDTSSVQDNEAEISAFFYWHESDRRLFFAALVLSRES